MKSKLFGLVALMAFAFTLVFAGVERANMTEDFIWVYADDGTTTEMPNCRPSEEICAYKHYFDETKEDNVGEPVLDENEEPVVQTGIRNTP